MDGQPGLERIDTAVGSPSCSVPRQMSDISKTAHVPVGSEEADDLARAQTLLAGDIIIPSDDEGKDWPEVSHDLVKDASTGDGSINEMPQYEATTASQNSSPGSVRTRSTWKAGLGEGNYQFSFENWVTKNNNPTSTIDAVSSSQRRANNASIDSTTSHENCETPQLSPTSAQSDRVPSMGNRLDFDLNLSQRNMRYNAIPPESKAESSAKTSSPVRMHARFAVGGSEGNMDANEAQFFPDYSSAFVGSDEPTPRKSQDEEAGSQPRVGSEGSVAESLWSTAVNMSNLQQMLMPPPLKPNPAKGRRSVLPSMLTEEHLTTRELSGDKSRNIRSDSPSPEKREDHRGVWSWKDSSPTQFFSIADMSALVSTQDQPIESSPLPQTSKGHSSGSNDTLDTALDVLSSPDSGYKADQSSGPATPGLSRMTPCRYGNRHRRPLGEVAKNVIN